MKRPLRLLLVEDSEEDAELLLFEIRNGGYDPVYVRVFTAEALRTALAGDAWDVVVSDYTMPQFGGLEALKIVRQFDPDLPFIINSGNIGEDIAVGAMHAGAHDYVMKSNLSRLVPAIERELREAVLRRAGRRAQRELLENEARFRAIVSNVPGVVFRMLREWHGGCEFTYVSEGSTGLLELAPATLQEDGALFFDLVLDADRGNLRARIGESAQTLQPLNWEGRIRVPSGDAVKWIELRMSPRPLDNNRIQWDGIMENITRRKQAELELNESRRQLSALSAHLQKAKEIERTRIAREVHDDIGGNLTAIKIDLLWLGNRIDRQRAELTEKVRALESAIDRTMEITSRIAHDLRPPLLELGLLAAIEWEAAEFGKRMEIPCVVSCASDDIPVDPELGTAVFSLFREILTNISKHAAATRVHVDVETDDSLLRLSVHDNGRGITRTDLLKSGSFGLRGMLERARHLGGEIRFDGNPGMGTTIVATLPLEPAHAAETAAVSNPSAQTADTEQP
jgi:two-component system sensor histidine kinase UhpB